MDISKCLKNPPTVTSAKSDNKPTPCDVVVGEGDPGQQSEPEPRPSSPVEPNPDRTYSDHGAEATSRSSATETGAVFGPQLPVGSVGVSDLGTDKPKQVVLKKKPIKMFG